MKTNGLIHNKSENEHDQQTTTTEKQAPWGKIWTNK